MPPPSQRPSRPPAPSPVDPIGALHAEVDRAVAPLQESLAARLVCRRGCADCCVDELTVFEVEAERIRRHAPELLASGAPHPVGRCAFLDAEGACRVYEARPYVCRTQGLPLRWTDEHEGAIVEMRDICPLNEGEEHAPITELPPESCWTLGPFEARLGMLQREREGDGGEGRRVGRRVALRDLFERRAGD